MFHFYRRLIELRHSNEIIVYGAYELLWPKDRQLFAYTRRWEDKTLLVVCNLSGCSAQAELPAPFAGKQPLISNLPGTKPEERMELRPWEAFAVMV